METIIVILLIVIIYLLSSLKTLYVNTNKKLLKDPDDSRNYKNTLYPIICENSIIYKQTILTKRANEIQDEWDKLRVKTSEEIKRIKKESGKQSDFILDKIKSIAHDYSFSMWMYKDAEEDFAAYMQANLDVLNGKKFKEVNDSFYKTKSTWDRIKFEKEMEETVKDLIKENWDKPEELKAVFDNE